jgi:hypothetical protein
MHSSNVSDVSSRSNVCRGVINGGSSVETGTDLLELSHRRQELLLPHFTYASVLIYYLTFFRIYSDLWKLSAWRYSEHFLVSMLQSWTSESIQGTNMPVTLSEHTYKCVTDYFLDVTAKCQPSAPPMCTAEIAAIVQWHLWCFEHSW